MQMRSGNMTLKQYITSQNYRRQVQNSNKKSHKKSDSFDSQKPNMISKETLVRSLSPGKYKRDILGKVQQIKIFARAVISKDVDFIVIEKLIEDLKHLFLTEIQNQRNNQELIRAIIDVSSTNLKSNPQTKTKIQPNSDQSLIFTPTKKEQNKPVKLFESIIQMKNSGKHIEQSVNKIKTKQVPFTQTIIRHPPNNLDNNISQTKKDNQKMIYPTSILKRSETPGNQSSNKKCHPQNDFTSVKFITGLQTRK